MRVMTNVYTHAEICKLALENEEIFNTFKNNPQYTSILEHVSKSQGQEYLNKIKEFSNYNLLDWEQYSKNDEIGNPIKYEYDLGNRKQILISPTTLRYISTGIDILNYVTNYNIKKSIKICEIGGGYGGQCKILFDLSKLFKVYIESYRIIDIPEVSLFQNKYLTKLHINNVMCQDCFNYNIENQDLLIANYSISEFDNDIRQQYIEDVVKNSSYYYIIWNTQNVDDYFQSGRTLPEIPLTGIDNKILIK